MACPLPGIVGFDSLSLATGRRIHTHGDILTPYTTIHSIHTSSPRLLLILTRRKTQIKSRTSRRKNNMLSQSLRASRSALRVSRPCLHSSCLLACSVWPFPSNSLHRCSIPSTSTSRLAARRLGSEAAGPSLVHPRVPVGPALELGEQSGLPMPVSCKRLLLLKPRC
jgi:hypothetical protein